MGITRLVHWHVCHKRHITAAEQHVPLCQQPGAPVAVEADSPQSTSVLLTTSKRMKQADTSSWSSAEPPAAELCQPPAVQLCRASY